MSSLANLHIMLAYVAYPVTTAVYIERALRQLCRVTTIGPSLPEELISEWDLESIRHLMYQQNIPTTFTPDMAQIRAGLAPENRPDLYLWVESVGGHFPENLPALQCPTACYLIDSHLRGIEWHLQWAQLFDYVFIAQLEYLPRFREVNPRSYWLPLGCDPEVHRHHEVAQSHDISFVGGTMFNPRRVALLESLERSFKLHKQRCFLDDMAKVFSASKIVFNSAVKHDLNMRIFETLSTGSFQLTDIAKKSGLTELFRDGEELAYYHCDEELPEVAEFYLKNSELREQIATRGQQVVHNAHTYKHRMIDMLAVIRGEKSDTLSVTELRAQSIAGLDAPFHEYRTSHVSISTESRSFVIPVLDYSPASEFNIGTLLHDLEHIPGEVIVIFNDRQVAAELQDHPRINRFAIMSHNIGVARAWNVGIDMATTPTVFILNADLHLERAAVDTVEEHLLTLADAACAGPQGSFVNFRMCRDFHYFDKGSFSAPIAVDAVSGFFFAIKREHFGPGKLCFENDYTPCYFEEWDLGLQIMQAGLKSYVVPTTAYCHHWSGSIAARREISCLGRSETPQDILLRNRLLFVSKWCNSEQWHQGSGYSNFCHTMISQYLRAGMDDDACKAAQHFAGMAPCLTELKILAGFTLGRCNRPQEARDFFKAALTAEPTCDLDAAITRLTATIGSIVS